MRHYYHATPAAIAALPQQALHETIVLPDGSTFSQIDWEHEPNAQPNWEARADVTVWGSLLEPGIPAASALQFAAQGIAANDSCYAAVKKMVQKFGGMRIKL